MSVRYTEVHVWWYTPGTAVIGVSLHVVIILYMQFKATITLQSNDVCPGPNMFKETILHYCFVDVCIPLFDCNSCLSCHNFNLQHHLKNVERKL